MQYEINLHISKYYMYVSFKDRCIRIIISSTIISISRLHVLALLEYWFFISLLIFFSDALSIDFMQDNTNICQIFVQRNCKMLYDILFCKVKHTLPQRLRTNAAAAGVIAPLLNANVIDAVNITRLVIRSKRSPTQRMLIWNNSTVTEETSPRLVQLG